jgi:integrase/recombinase XerC
MFEAMLRGWQAQQAARGLREETAGKRDRLVRRFMAFTGEYPWGWLAGHMDEWSLCLTSEEHLAPSTIRGYQGCLRQFTEFLTDARYGWVAACEREFGQGNHPVAICHEWNTIAHLNDYEGDPEARPFTREEMQRLLDYADDQVERAARSRRKGALGRLPRCDAVQGDVRLGPVLRGPPGVPGPWHSAFAQLRGCWMRCYLLRQVWCNDLVRRVIWAVSRG